MVLVHHNVSTLVCLNTGLLQSEIVGVGVSTDSPNQRIHLQRVARVEMQGEWTTTLALYALHIGAFVYMQAGVAHVLHECVGDDGVKVAQERVVADQEVRL